MLDRELSCCTATTQAECLYPSQITRTPTPPAERAPQPTFVIDVDEPVLGGPLYLSSHALAHDPAVLRALGITHVINVTPDHPNAPGMEHPHHEGIVSYLRIPVVDSVDVDIGQYFAQACEFIDRAFDRPRGARAPAVLVHCRHGQSRSGTIVAAWLMHRSRSEHGVAAGLASATAAVRYLKECRPRVSPNGGFLKQLEEAAADGDSFARGV